MRILFVVAALFLLSGCETLALDSVSIGVSNHSYGHHYNHPGYISYTLGFYNSHRYNGYDVYGFLGHRYYYAPRYYSHHRYYTRPHYYVQPTHNYIQPRRQRQHVVPPQPQRQVQNKRVNHENRIERNNHRQDQNKKRK